MEIQITDTQINLLKALSKNINKTIIQYKHSSKKLRNRKTKIIDAIAFRLLYGQNKSTQNLATAFLNMFLNIQDKKDLLSRVSLLEKEEKIPLELYENISKSLDKFLNTLNKNKSLKYHVYAADGTFVNMNKELIKDGFPINQKPNVASGYMMGIYDITLNAPVTLDMCKHNNERKAFIDYFQNSNNYKNSIFIFDRGYFSDDLIKFLESKEIKYVCRLKEKINIVKNLTANDYKTIYNQTPIRVIKYTIDNKDYFLGTNLNDENEFSINILKTLYHERWKIEEYFKHIKYVCKLADMNEKKSNSIYKTVFAQLIVTQLTHIIQAIVNMNIPLKDKTVINKNLLTDGIYKFFLLNFLYNRRFSSKTIKQFLLIYIHYTHTQTGKHYERIAIKPYKKWNLIHSRNKADNKAKENIK